MVDDQTGTTWGHLDGLAVAGSLEGAQLPILPLQMTTWGAWVDANPATTVIDVDTGYAYREQVQLGRDALRGGFLNTLDGIDERLPAGELVIGVLAGSEAVAFPIEVGTAMPRQVEVDGIPVVILEDANGVPSLAYHRALSDGRVLSFDEGRQRILADPRFAEQISLTEIDIMFEQFHQHLLGFDLYELHALSTHAGQIKA